MKFKPFLSLLIIFIISYSNTSLGKENDVANFDISIEKLPTNYKGTDISALYSMLSKKIPINKNEFESTVEYENKLSELVSNNTFAFKLSPTEFNYAGGMNVAPYNADKEQYQISIRAVALSNYTFQDYRSSIIVQTLNRSTSSYIGSNAFGAKRNVKDFKDSQYGLAFVNKNDFGNKEYEYAYSLASALDSNRIFNFEIGVSPNKAKILKNNIASLLLCKLALYDAKIKEPHRNIGNNLFFKTNYYIQATIDNPNSILHERNYINVEMLEIWIYDTSTGIILDKKQLNN